MEVEKSEVAFASKIVTNPKTMQKVKESIHVMGNTNLSQVLHA